MSATYSHELNTIIRTARIINNLEVHIIGNCSTEQNKDHLPDNVFVYGYIDDKRKTELLRKCDFGINLTYMTYGMNVKTMEFFANGTPLLSNKCGIRGYNVRENREYIPANEESIIDDITSFLNLEEDKRYDIAVNAFQYISNQHNYDSYIHIIDELLCNNESETGKSSYYIFGAGMEGKKAYNELKHIGHDIVGFVDNNHSLHGTEIQGLQIYSPQEALAMIKNEEPYAKLVIATANAGYLADIYRQVIRQISEESISFYYRGLDDREIDRTKLMINQ